MSGRLRWKRRPAPTGLSRIGAPHSGWKLHDGEETFASVYPKGGGWRCEQTGWYWVAHGPGIELHNTAREPVATPDAARAAAMQYVKEQLARATQPLPPPNEE